MTTATKTKVKIQTTITDAVMVEKLKDRKTATFCRLVGDTELKMNKGGREHSNSLHGLVRTVADVNVVMGFTYETVVNNARIKELFTRIMDNIENEAVLAELLKDFDSDEIQAVAAKESEKFIAEAHGFATPLDGTSKYILAYGKEVETQDKERLYLKVLVLHTKPIRTYRTDTGENLTDAEWEIVKKYKPTKKAEGGRQGLDNPKIYRNYKVKNVKELKYGKDDNYKIIGKAVLGKVDTKTPVSSLAKV